MDTVPDFWLLMQVKDASNLFWENWNLGIYYYFVVDNLKKMFKVVLCVVIYQVFSNISIWYVAKETQMQKDKSRKMYKQKTKQKKNKQKRPTIMTISIKSETYDDHQILQTISCISFIECDHTG